MILHLIPSTVLLRHDYFIIINVCNVFVLVYVSQDAVIDRYGLVSPELEVGVAVFVHPEVGQYGVIGLGVRKCGYGYLQNSNGLVVFKYLPRRLIHGIKWQ